MNTLIYILLLGSIMYLLWAWGKKQGMMNTSQPAGPAPRPRNRFRARKSANEIWVQVYETASMDEAKMLQARLQEEELECILYEQGKKDIHGNTLRGVGIAVPKTAVPHSQNLISRMLT